MKELKIFRVILVALFAGCLPDSSKYSNEFEGEYFSVREMIERDILKFENEHYSLSKTLVVDTEQSSESRDSIDWTKEFRLFLDSDINKPALVNGYTADTVYTETGYSINYNAIDTTSFTRRLTVTFEGNEPAYLNITNRKETMYYTASEQLEYHSGKSFSINVMNKIVTGDVVSFRIEGVISKVH